MKISLVVIFLSFTLSHQTDLTDDIANAIRSGNSKELSKYFGDKIDLKILQLEEIYSKPQAELIIKDFFSKHPVESFYIAHKGPQKGESLFAIGVLQTSKGKFRTYFFLKKVSNKFLIQQLRIELEK